jgi:hypothetical protein
MYSNSFALITSLLAAGVFYLGCPNQQWFAKRPLCFYPALGLSLVLVIVSWWLFHQSLTSTSATFTVICVLMLILGILPFLSRLQSPGNPAKKQNKSIEKGALTGYKPHWWPKTLIALLMGYPLSVGIAGLLAWWGPGEAVVDDRTQLVMWLVTPIWLINLSLIYFVARLKRIFFFYVGFSSLIYLALWVARSGS